MGQVTEALPGAQEIGVFKFKWTSQYTSINFRPSVLELQKKKKKKIVGVAPPDPGECPICTANQHPFLADCAQADWPIMAYLMRQ
jgi:hypothetical protein